MPNVLKYTPSWLSRPSPGFDLFSLPPRKPSLDTKDAAGPNRTIAHRGTEIFVAVENELRWSDLTALRDNWEAHHHASHSPSQSRARASIIDERANETAYRILKVPISRNITQLVISPTGDYVAILTSHTIHVAILPDSSHLNSEDTSPLKLKTFHVGPTAHVLEHSRIASALWHPLGVKGNCLVTITVDAIVRIWELDTKNRWSFDSPSTAVDLKKLADCVSSSEDFSPSKYGTSKGFSPDSFEMEVASACFGGDDAEHGTTSWGSMTLWLAMREGDIYALCPFLPSRFTGDTFSLSGLSSSIACDFSFEEETDSTKSKTHRKQNDQTLWISDLVEQMKSEPSSLQRPTRLGPVPMLQGPFQITPETDQIFDITDIHVVAAKPNTMNSNDELSSTSEDSAQVGIACIATSDGKVHLCVDLNGIEGRWLPHASQPNAYRKLESDLIPELLLVESVVLSESPNGCWAVFSKNARLPNSFFVTHDCGVSHLDISDWTEGIKEELDAYADAGVQVRSDLLLQHAMTALEHPIQLRPVRKSDNEIPAPDVPACVTFLDSDLGWLVLTSVDCEPRAVTLQESAALEIVLSDDEGEDSEAENLVLPIHDPRPPYQPSREFWKDSTIVEFVSRHPFNRGHRMMKEEVKFSPATLKILMDVHRKLSEETHRLGQAAAELFRHCERLHVEFRQQIKGVNLAFERVESVTGANMDVYDDKDEAIGTRNQIQRRLEIAKERQETLQSRYTEFRQKVGRLNGRSLNDKEKSWITEVGQMYKLLGRSDSSGASGTLPPDNTAQLQYRLEKLKKARSVLLEEASTHNKEANGRSFSAAYPAVLGVRSTVMLEIDAMLERQSALIDATSGKLGKLSTLSM